MKKLLLFIALASCQVSPSTSLDPQLCLEDDPTMLVNNQPFNDGVGQFSMTGTVEAADTVYLVVSDDGSEAFNYFYELAGKLDIDHITGEQLYLKLGILKDGELVSSAHVMDPEKILSALNSGYEITLNMLMGASLGKGASAASVNPCLIE